MEVLYLAVDYDKPLCSLSLIHILAADYLLSLINDILQMSKIEDGNVPLTQETVSYTHLDVYKRQA